jgi:hypothetical protein
MMRTASVVTLLQKSASLLPEGGSSPRPMDEGFLRLVFNLLEAGVAAQIPY